MNVRENMAALSAAWHNCNKCPIGATRQGPDIFFGYGSLTAKYFFVGGGPSETDETYSGIFSGDYGDFLVGAMEKLGISRGDSYFTYAVACRPKSFIPATEQQDERIEGRVPSREELTACRPRLNEMIYQIDPRVIITLGEWATKTVVRTHLPKFTDVVGKQYKCTLHRAVPEDHAEGKVLGKGRYWDVSYPVFALPDPASIFINTSTAKHGPSHVFHQTLFRANAYVNFLLHTEAETMNTKVNP